MRMRWIAALLISLSRVAFGPTPGQAALAGCPDGYTTHDLIKTYRDSTGNVAAKLQGSFFHWSARFVAVAVPFSMLIVAPAQVEAGSPASIAVGCHGAACNGKSPEVQGCGDDAVTVDSFLAPVAPSSGSDTLVELRHSPACRARWLRVTPQDNPYHGCGGGPPLEVRIRDIEGDGTVLHTESKTYYGCEDRFWTMMVGKGSTSVRVRFCHRVGDHPWIDDNQYVECKTQAW